MKKFIRLEIKIDSDNDEVGNIITVKGYDARKPIQNTLELIGLLEFIKQQEILKVLKGEVKI